ncbi:hypothetical protein PMIT1303_00164 [Prochlorococcus sp. MIT 1303]|nr:hypothetical protein PMIT1303_00164 [Prochlorococcus sp. MIT 1303]
MPRGLQKPELLFGMDREAHPTNAKQTPVDSSQPLAPFRGAVRLKPGNGGLSTAGAFDEHPLHDSAQNTKASCPVSFPVPDGEKLSRN